MLFDSLIKAQSLTDNTIPVSFVTSVSTADDSTPAGSITLPIVQDGDIAIVYTNTDGYEKNLTSFGSNTGWVNIFGEEYYINERPAHYMAYKILSASDSNNEIDLSSSTTAFVVTILVFRPEESGYFKVNTISKKVNTAAYNSISSAENVTSVTVGFASVQSDSIAFSSNIVGDLILANSKSCMKSYYDITSNNEEVKNYELNASGYYETSSLVNFSITKKNLNEEPVFPSFYKRYSYAYLRDGSGSSNITIPTSIEDGDIGLFVTTAYKEPDNIGLSGWFNFFGETYGTYNRTEVFIKRLTETDRGASLTGLYGGSESGSLLYILSNPDGYNINTQTISYDFKGSSSFTYGGLESSKQEDLHFGNTDLLVFQIVSVIDCDENNHVPVFSVSGGGALPVISYYRAISNRPCLGVQPSIVKQGEYNPVFNTDVVNSSDTAFNHVINVAVEISK